MPAEPSAPPTFEVLVELARTLQATAVGMGLTIATAESCTGGLLGHVLTEVPGSSAYFVGGVISYADDAKVDVLQVPREAILTDGAVSEPVAAAMAEGARALLDADLAAAVTGIAGPGGDTPGKPTGLTFIAVADAAGTVVQRHVWDGDRATNKRSSVAAALLLLLDRATALDRIAGEP